MPKSMRTIAAAGLIVAGLAVIVIGNRRDESKQTGTAGENAAFEAPVRKQHFDFVHSASPVSVANNAETEPATDKEENCKHRSISQRIESAATTVRNFGGILSTVSQEIESATPFGRFLTTVGNAGIQLAKELELQPAEDKNGDDGDNGDDGSAGATANLPKPPKGPQPPAAQDPRGQLFDDVDLEWMIISVGKFRQSV